MQQPNTVEDMLPVGTRLIMSEECRLNLPECVVVPEDGIITLHSIKTLPIIGPVYTCKLPSTDGGTHNVMIRRAIADSCQVVE